jgi:hypothetical protein
MKILKMTLNKEFFDQILSGEKIEEYRDFTPFWESRLLEKDTEEIVFREYDAIEFKNGYGAEVPTMLVEWKGADLVLYDDAPDDSEDPEDYYFIIDLGKILETKNC